MKSILFVCSANQCRSPMAEVMFKKLVRDKGEEEHWRVESAGVWAFQGAPATENAMQVMVERELDLSQHLSQPVNPTMLSRFDVIVVMTLEHKRALLQQYPAITNRVFLLRELGGEKGDFADPVGGTLDTYRDTADELEILLRRGYSSIKSAAAL